jgi:signal transduction histidine kinase
MTGFSDREQLLSIFRVLIALLALQSCQQLAQLDSFVLNLLGITQASAQPPEHLILIALPAILAGALAIYSGEVLSDKHRLMVMLQLISLSFLVQWFLLTTYKLPIAPMSAILTVLAGTLMGNVLKRQNQKQSLMQTSLMQLQMTNDEIASTRLSMVKQDEADRRIRSRLTRPVLNDLNKLKQTAELPKSPDTDQLRQLLDQSANQIRTVMENLTPSVLENLGLISALEDLLSQSAQRANLRTRLDKGSVETLSFDPVEELLIYRIAQEVLNNTIKHAGARQVTVKIESTSESVIISITDDGKGIEPDKERGISRGLRYIRQRADILGAIASWHPGKDNKGTTFKLQIPLRGQ